MDNLLLKKYIWSYFNILRFWAGSEPALPSICTFSWYSKCKKSKNWIVQEFKLCNLLLLFDNSCKSFYEALVEMPSQFTPHEVTNTNS